MIKYSDKYYLLNKRNVYRSNKWFLNRIQYLSEHNFCVVCGENGSPDKCGVHHIIPYHIFMYFNRPELEFDFNNLMTLCVDNKEHTTNNHHLLLGHLNSYYSFNVNIFDDVVTFVGMNKYEILNSLPFKLNVLARPKPLLFMNESEKLKIQFTINTLFKK